MSGTRPRIQPRSRTLRRVGLVVWLGIPVLSAASAAGFAWALSAQAAPQPQAPASPATTAAPSAAPQQVFRTHAEDASNLVGSSSCRECHPGEAAAFSGSGHAKTLRRGLQRPSSNGSTTGL
ncbi:MAG: hypothetical protein U0835_12435 [Isosphaeraceae bacterium]